MILGKVGPAVEDAGEINRVLKKSVKLKVHSNQVGAGRRRYILLGYEETENREKR